MPGSLRLNPGGVAVMGVLNVTPDSFSDGGEHDDPDRAVRHALALVDAGASVVDVGGESTRPGARPVDPDEEQARVMPVLERLAGPVAARGARLSIDTRHAATARAAVAAGATLVNDVGASLAPVAADLGVGWVAVHMAGEPTTMQDDPRYDDVVDEVRSFLAARAAAARDLGVQEVWVDPGIGFGKTTEHNLALLAHLDRIVADGHPVLVGTSRKRLTADLTASSDRRVGARPPGPVAVGDREDASLATATWAMLAGARMVRVHDVAPAAQAALLVAGRLGPADDGVPVGGVEGPGDPLPSTG